MIAEDNIQNRREIIKLIAAGRINKQQIKRLSYDETLDCLRNYYIDEVNVYLAELRKFALPQLKFLRGLIAKNEMIN